MMDAAFAEDGTHASQKNILMVSSLNLETEWGRLLLKGFNSSFAIDKYSISYVGLSNWDNPDSVSDEQNLETILRKVGKTRYEMLVAFGPQAMALIAKNIDKFPKDLSMMMAAAIEPLPPELAQRPATYISKIYIPYEENILLAQRMFPGVKKMVTFFDSSIEGAICKADMLGVIETMKHSKNGERTAKQSDIDDLEFIFLGGNDYSTKEALEKLSEISKEPICTFVYSWSSTKDKASESPDLNDFIGMVSKIADKSVFVFFDDTPEYVLGGYMIGGIQYAASIGEKVKRILDGEATDTSGDKRVPTLKINWEIFSQKGFHIGMLPSGVDFYHTQPDFFDRLNFKYISAGLAVIALLSVVLVIISIRASTLSKRHSILLKNLPSDIFVFFENGDICYSYLSGSTSENIKSIFEFGEEFTQAYKRNLPKVKAGDNLSIEYTYAKQRRRCSIVKISERVFGDNAFLATTVDITELQGAAIRLKTTLSSIGDAVIAADKSNLITFANPVALSLMNVSLDEILNRNINDVYKIFSQIDDSVLPSPTERVSGSEGALPQNSRYMPLKNGGRIHISDSVSPIVMDGDRQGIILVFRDVSREYLHREQIMASVNSQKVINDCLSFALRSEDHEATVAKMLQLLGTNMKSDRAFIYKFNPDNGDFSSLNYWNDPKIKDKEFKIGQVPQNEGNLMMEKFGRGEVIKYSTKPGFENPDFPELLKLHIADEIKVSMVVGVFENGKICGFMGADYVTQYHDYTKSDEALLRGVAKIAELDFERHSHMEKAKAAENERRMILESIQVPIMLFDGKASLVASNNAAAKFADTSAKDAQNSTLLYPVELAIKEKRTVQMEMNISSRDLIAVATPIFDAEGKIANVIENTSDVTELVAANKKLEKAMQAAQESEKAKSYFLATMSHELRTPLNAVIGYSELTQNPKIKQDERVENLKSINFAANTLLNLINDILDLSKLEAGQIDIHKAPLSLQSIAMEFANIFKFEALKRGIQLDVDVQNDIPMLMMDLLRLKQVLMNVIGNAIKFTSKGSVNVKISFEEKDKNCGALTISIKDSGIGISPKHLEKIFNPFEQDNTQRIRGQGGFEGTGLGLTIVKRLLEKMDGDVKVSSQVNVGSTFTLYFANVEIFTGTLERHSSSGSAGIHVSMEDSTFDATILVVDDVVMNVKVLRNILKNFGINVIECLSAAEALEALNTSTPDLIMTDLWMPEINGEQFAKMVKANPATSHIRVVAVTADTQIDDDAKVFNDLLFKPITMRGVFSILEKHLPHKHKTWSRQKQEA